MENRILIKEDLEKFIEISKDLKQFKPVLNELKSSFEALQIGALTDKDFKQIILLGPTKHTEIYVKNLNNQLDKLGVVSSIIRQNAIKSITGTGLLIHRSQIVEINNQNIIVRAATSKLEPIKQPEKMNYINPFRSSTVQSDLNTNEK